MLPSVDFARGECRKEEKKKKTPSQRVGGMIQLTTYKVSLARICIMLEEIK
jgi:hypothetical protein